MRNNHFMYDVAKNLITKIGSIDRVADIAGVHRSNVHRWTYPKIRGGTGGMIPSRHHLKIIMGAKEKYNIQILPQDLMPNDFFNLTNNG